MNKNLYIDYLNKPDSLDENSLDNIKLLLQEYPYFQTFRLLYIKNLHIINDVRYESQLKQTATYIPDREILYKMIHSPEEIIYQTKSSDIKDEDSSQKSPTPEPEDPIVTEQSSNNILTETQEINKPEEKSEDNNEDTQTIETPEQVVISEHDNQSLIEDTSDINKEEEEVVAKTEIEKEELCNDDEKTEVNKDDTQPIDTVKSAVISEHDNQSLIEDTSDINKVEEEVVAKTEIEKEELCDDDEKTEVKPENNLLPSKEKPIDAPIIEDDKPKDERKSSTDISDIIIKKIKIAKGEEEYDSAVDDNNTDNVEELKQKIQQRLNELSNKKQEPEVTNKDVEDKNNIKEDIQKINNEHSEEKTSEPEIENEKKNSNIGLKKSSLIEIINNKFKADNSLSVKKSVSNSDNSESVENDLSSQTENKSFENNSSLVAEQEVIDSDDFFENDKPHKKAKKSNTEIINNNTSRYNSEEIEKTYPKSTLNKSKKTELIDKFIEENNTAISRENVLDKEGSSFDFSTSNEGEFFSETLANIYIKQGHYEKALLTYEKLFLKYPEKSIYFASQIKKVKEIINNK